MHFLFYSVLCSVAVSVLLKTARGWHINIYQAIGWGYWVAAGLTLLVFRPSFHGVLTGLTKEYSTLIVCGVLTVLLPSVFVLLFLSVEKAGIVRTDVAQRLSLVLSLIAAFYYFDEKFTLLKLGGIVTGLAAILFCIHREKKAYEASFKSRSALLGVFVGFALIDICFKKIAQIQTIPYFTSLLIIFIGAGILSMGGNLWLWIRKIYPWEIRSAAGGLLLGIFNFGNILFYVRGHQILSDSPALVFTAMNIGVVVLGTMVGLVLFHETLSKLNIIGILLAILAITFLALAKL